MNAESEQASDAASRIKSYKHENEDGKLGFGKWKELTWDEVALVDKNYVYWYITEHLMKDNAEDDFRALGAASIAGRLYDLCDKELTHNQRIWKLQQIQESDLSSATYERIKDKINELTSARYSKKQVQRKRTD